MVLYLEFLTQLYVSFFGVGGGGALSLFLGRRWAESDCPYLFSVRQPKMINVLDMFRNRVNKVTQRHNGGGGGGQSDPSPLLLLTPFIRLTRYLAHIMSVLCTFN